MRMFISLLAVVGFGCNSVNKGACKSYMLDVCDECDVDGFTKDVTCACLEDGEVDDEDYFEDGDAAERYCAYLIDSLKGTYLTNEDISECRLLDAELKEWGGDFCEDYGWEDDGYYDYR